MGRNGIADEISDEAPLGTDALFVRVHARVAQNRGRSALSLEEWVDLATAWRITHALRECLGNRSAAARALGIGRRTLYTKMQKLGVASDWETP